MSDEIAEIIGDDYLQRFAFASLVLGILSIVLSLFWIGSLCAVLGLIFGIIALYKNAGKREHAIWGIVTSCIGLLIPVVLIILILFGFFGFLVMM